MSPPRERAVLHDIEHGIVYLDPERYAGHVNRGGLWHLGGGELAVAHLVRRADYASGDDVRKPYAHVYATGRDAGVLLHRSIDGGRTWPATERRWVWHNERPLEAILDWLRPRAPEARDAVDLRRPGAVFHLGCLEYLRFPLGGGHLLGHPAARPEHRDAVFAPPQQPGFCLRSADGGRTWERWPSLLRGEPADGPVTWANLGHVWLHDGRLAVAASSLGRSHPAVWASADDGASWARVGDLCPPAADAETGFTYLGLHRLPDGRLLATGHRMPQNLPCVTVSADEGSTWGPLQPIVAAGAAATPAPPTPTPRACHDLDGQPAQRSPCGLVLRDGRILVVFARRAYSGRPERGLLAVVSHDLGATWSDAVVLRGDQYTWDGGYPLLAELPDGTLFAAYYITTRQHEVGDHGDGDVPEWACVRHIAWSRFRL